MKILAFNGDQKIFSKLEEIFWKTVLNPPSDKKRREELSDKYFHHYLNNNLPIFYATSGDEVLGYILGDLKTDKSHYLKTFPYYESLKSEIQNYPAHLHINCDPGAQGRGVGSLLLAHFENFCAQNGAQGIHLITSKEARNVSFYLKNSYQVLTPFDYRGVSLLFLAKKL